MIYSNQVRQLYSVTTNTIGNTRCTPKPFLQREVHENLAGLAGYLYFEAGSFLHSKFVVRTLVPLQP